MSVSPNTPRTIDLNCDLGEGILDNTVELALLDFITSANIACGGHAGTRTSMLRIATACDDCGIALGAHPSYPDKENFGRKAVDMTPEAIEEAISLQLLEMERNAYRRNVRHIKPHGALYHAAMTSPAVADAIARAATKLRKKPILVGQAGSASLDLWRSLGFKVAAEAFADRKYEPNGKLRSREHPDALITSPAAAAEQARRIALGEGVITSDGSVLPMSADTICIHSDTPGSVAIAQAVRQALESSGTKLQALA